MNAAQLLSLPPQALDTLIVKRSAKALSTELEDETIILDLESGIYSGLDEVATRIWQLLEQEMRIDALRNQLLSEYEVDEGQCHEDLVAFLQDLAANDLLEVGNGADQ